MRVMIEFIEVKSSRPEAPIDDGQLSEVVRRTRRRHWLPRYGMVRGHRPGPYARHVFVETKVGGAFGQETHGDAGVTTFNHLRNT